MTTLIIGLVILAPALEVLLSSRDLIIEDYLPTLANEDSSVMHYATALSVLCALLIIGLCALQGRTHLTSVSIAGALLVFYVTNVVLPSGLGAVPFVSRSHLYAFIIFIALYMSRDDGANVVVDAARNSLLLMMTASLVCLFAAPELTRRVYEPEVRLPFIDFRFWGLGSSANGVAPLALQLALFTYYRPYKFAWLNWVSLASAFAVVLLAQSQTIWLTSALVLPLFLLYRHGSLRLEGLWRSKNARLATTALTALAVIVVVAHVAADPGARSAGASDSEGLSLTGRTDVWEIAWNTFVRHPVFGYGVTAWQDDFREMIGLPWAFHAHNQLMQSLSVGGAVGGIGLLIYVGVLVKASWAAAASTRGLAPALLAIILIRSITEAPLDMGAALLSEAAIHLVLFRLLTAPLPPAGPDRWPQQTAIPAASAPPPAR